MSEEPKANIFMLVDESNDEKEKWWLSFQLSLVCWFAWHMPSRDGEVHRYDVVIPIMPT